MAATPLYARQRDTLGIGGPTYFVENLGQWHPNVRFKAQMHNAAFFAENNCFTITLRETPKHEDDEHFHHKIGTTMHAYKVHFVGANTKVSPQGEDIDPNGGYDNYFYGQDTSRWVSHLPHYMTLRYNNLYNGIDMDVRMAEHAMKSNFYVAPHADASQIVMHYEGAEKLYLSNGNLIIRTAVGEIVELKPYAYQQIGDSTIEIEAHYLHKGDEVRIILGSYDHSLPLVIDPVLHFSSYTGSTADNWGTTATFDIYKNTYTAGLVFAVGYPTSPGVYDGSYNNNADIGIFKFDTSGTQRLFATYMGGTQADMPHSLFVNSFNELVLFGTTGSSDFPVTPNAYDGTFNGGTSLQFENTTQINFPNGSDIFVSRFSEDGSQLQASTYVGGSGNDGLNYRQRYNNSYLTIMAGNDSLYYNYGDGARGELITDDLNNVYVGSTTMSTDFPTNVNSLQTLSGLKQEGIVFKLDYNLRNMIWSTYLGGNGDDAVYSIDVDKDYNLLVCGGTNSTDFATTPEAFQTSYGGGSADGFVCKISYNGERLMHSTYYGSSAYDQLYFVRSGRNDEVFVFGQTKASGSTMIYNANYNVPGSGMLLARLHPDLDSREWSTVFGTTLGRPNLSPTAFACDICNRVYAAGWGRDFVGYNGVNWNTAGTTSMETTTGAYQSTTDGQDFYIMSMSEDASQLDYATFFGEVHGPTSNGGGDHVDGGTSRFDKMATLYQSVCASCGGYDGFPTTAGAWSRHNNSPNCNNALFRFNVHDDFAVADFVTPPVGCTPYNVQFQNTGRGDSFLWDFGDGNSSTATHPSHTYTQPGTYTVRLIANKNYGCKPSDTMEATIMVLNPEGNKTFATANCTGEAMQIGVTPMLGCTYEWISGNVSDNSIANPYVYESGSYILRITALSGCSQIDTFNVHYIAVLDSLIVISPTCPGGNDGRVIARNSSSDSDSTLYYWDGVLGDSISTGYSADGLIHTLTIVSHGCTLDTFFTISDPETLQIDKTNSTILCSDDCDGWIHLDYHYNDYPVGDTLLQHLCEGTYIIQIADTAGCPYNDTTVIIRDTMLRHMRTWADDTILFLNESTQLHATHIPRANYSWSNAHTLDHPTTPDPTATPEDTLSIYTVTVVDSLGCVWNGNVTLHCTEVICGRPNIFIPNVFSPNDDGINDKLCFRGQFVLDFEIAIYTRWGEKIFETHDIHDCWDGRYNGNWCLPGVYTYYCRVKCEAGEENLLKGDITLIR